MARGHFPRLVQGERAVVQTKEGQTLRGLIERVASDCLLMVAPEELVDNGQGAVDVIQLEGNVVIERPVAYVQILGGTV